LALNRQAIRRNSVTRDASSMASEDKTEDAKDMFKENCYIIICKFKIIVDLVQAFQMHYDAIEASSRNTKD